MKLLAILVWLYISLICEKKIVAENEKSSFLKYEFEATGVKLSRLKI